jgi:hypothetical protein
MQNYILNAQLTNLLLFPFIFLKEELDAILVGKHPTRSAFRVILTSIGCIVGGILFYQSTVFPHFLNGIVAALGVPSGFQSLATLYACITSGGSIVGFCARTITKAFCYFKYGDPDFYLTKQREDELIEAFRHQGYNITGDTIRKVIEFCIKNFRRSPLHDFGSHPYDWKRMLDALIYDGDLEVFLEQQELLQKKLRKTIQRCNALSKYGSAVDLEKSLLWSFKNQTKFSCEEEQPLLQCQTSQNADNMATSLSVNSLTSLPREIREKMMVVKVLAKFKQHHKHHEHHELLHHCSTHLRKQEQNLTDVIFPLQFSPSSTNTVTPSSGGSSIVYEPDVVSYSFNYANPNALRPRLTP